MVRIEAVTEATPEVHAALARLLPQLNPTLAVPTMERLQAIVADPAVTLLVARDEHEVVVDESARGKGVGAALVRASVDLAREKGVEVVELQSAVHRAEANRLYPRMGFKLRETNVYRLVL